MKTTSVPQPHTKTSHRLTCWPQTFQMCHRDTLKSNHTQVYTPHTFNTHTYSMPKAHNTGTHIEHT